MENKLTLDGIYVLSADLVVREIQGELIIVPLVAGMGDLEDEIFTLNDTGKAIWNKLDGKNSLAEISQSLAEEFDTPLEKVQEDVVGFMNEIFTRNMVKTI
jgi:coenzyme PQQ synthesis protein D (PqqD)